MSLPCQVPAGGLVRPQVLGDASGTPNRNLVFAMPISVSTDPIRPTERRAYWTESICRSFAHVETRPLGSADVSGHFEFVELGGAKLVRFDSSPQCYTRDARLV